MQVGMIGLGRMGANMTERLIGGGHEVVGFDLFPDAVTRIVEIGATGVDSVAALAVALDTPRTVWIMVPHGDPVEATLDALLPHLEPGDTVIDGGNSRYTDTVRRSLRLTEHGVDLVDVGTSGGVWGLTEGYSMMVGGLEATVDRLRPIFETLAPTPTSGWGRVGGSGAGHYVKMIHNGVEYGLMQAYAEGFAVLRAKTEYDFDLAGIGEIWEHGSVVRSWLLELTTRALRSNPALDGIAPYVADSGEGRWALAEAIDLDVATPVIGLSLLSRLASRNEFGFSDRLLAAMRNEFGGHAIRTESLGSDGIAP